MIQYINIHFPSAAHLEATKAMRAIKTINKAALKSPEPS